MATTPEPRTPENMPVWMLADADQLQARQEEFNRSDFAALLELVARTAPIDGRLMGASRPVSLDDPTSPPPPPSLS